MLAPVAVAKEVKDSLYVFDNTNMHLQITQELIRRWDSERELVTTTSYNTSKYNPLLNIQHDAGRATASGCVLVRKALKARRLATTEYSMWAPQPAQHGHGLLPVQQSRARRQGNNDWLNILPPRQVNT